MNDQHSNKKLDVEFIHPDGDPWGIPAIRIVASRGYTRADVHEACDNVQQVISQASTYVLWMLGTYERQIDLLQSAGRSVPPELYSIHASFSNTLFVLRNQALVLKDFIFNVDLSDTPA